MVFYVKKRDGHLEKFDERKILLSCYEACMNVHLSRKECEKASELITDKLIKSLKNSFKNKKEIPSDYIFKEVIKFLSKYNRDVAFMFETHRDIS